MSPRAVRFPTLRRLVGAYLHEDFDLHGPRPEDAVRAFLAAADAQTREALAADAEAFLAAHATEGARRRALARMRLGPDLARHGYASAEAFLRRVAAMARGAPDVSG